MIRIQAIIDKQGKIETTVLDRQGESSCTLVYNVTSKVGTTKTDEVTGPDCDTNVSYEGDSLVLLARRREVSDNVTSSNR